MGRLSPRATTALALALALVPAFAPPPAAAARVRAAYAYEYMPASHVDSLADRGFTRVLVHAITDSPDDGRASAEVPCPLDSAYWRSALLDRAGEYLAVGAFDELAIDLELYRGPRHHLDGGACRCDACVAEYLASTPATAKVPERRRLAGMAGFQEARLARVLAALLREFAARHPGVRLAVLDLDYDAFPHRALARALARAGVPTADYCERSYGIGGTPLRGARARLDALGLAGTPLVGGVWLGRFTPRDLVPAMASIDAVAEGTWAFTTYSLWQDPSRLTGPYALLGGVPAYWDALARANREP